MARPFPRSAAQRPDAAIFQHDRSPARRAGFAASGPELMLPSGDGDLHLGGAAARFQIMGCGGSACCRVRMDAGAIGGTGTVPKDQQSGLISMLALLRTFLILGRVSNLPTIWSNCLAGWWLGGAENTEKVPLLFAGTSFLYLGGMFLNDAFDADFDREYRKERPIPSGAISLGLVYRWGLIWLGLGGVCLILLGGR